MLSEIHTLPKPNRPKNDDIAGFEGSATWLMDGATQLVAPAHGLDAAWHVGRMDAAFRDALKETPEIDLRDLARNAIVESAVEFYQATGLAADAPQELRPFATLVLCRVSAARDALDYFVICDSTLAVIRPGHETVISDRRIEEGDFLAATDALLKQGHDFDSEIYREAMRAVYCTVAPKINQPGGFDVAGQDSTVVDRALAGRIALRPDDHILLMSDGFTRAVDTLGLYGSWSGLLEGLKERGAAQVFQDIRAAEMQDAAGHAHPRSSRHDDATALWQRNNG